MRAERRAPGRPSERREEGLLKLVDTIKRQHAEITRVERGRLFRKYFLLILALVCGALLISGGVGLYFSYQENKAAIASLEREKALNAAARIGQFVRQVEQQLAYAAPQLGVETLEQRRLELMKLQRFAKEVTDVSQIDAAGREQLFESRLAMSVVASGKDRSAEPEFVNARPGRTWFGPVYFRKETEPYMSIALRSGGEKGPVTVAEVNLKFIWDVVSRIRVGQKGKAYVVDGAGYLIADPDIGLVLRKTNLSGLAQVRAALQANADAERAMLAKDFNGNAVLTAWAPVDLGVDSEGRRREPLGWKVFVEQPVSEVFQALDATILRTVLFIVAGLLFSALVAMWLARSMARPIRVLEEGARRIGAGELDHQIDVHTGDELEALAAQFNHMSAQLRESYAGLERKVEARTQELKESLEQQTAISEILRVISSSPADVQPVLQAVAERAARICDAQDADIIVVQGDRILVAASVGKLGRPTGELVPLDRTTVMGRSIVDKASVHITDLQSADAEFPLGAPLARRFGHHSILAMPLIRESRALGTILLRRGEVRPFEDKHIALLATFADQAAIAIENVRLFNETKEALEQQTATAEILRVIAGSPTDTQPVFDAIVKSALRIFGGMDVSVGLLAGDAVEIRASSLRFGEKGRGVPARIALDHDSCAGCAILDHASFNIADIEAPATPPTTRARGRATGWRSIAVVPLLREGVAIGHIAVHRREALALTDKQFALLRTFADQAVIAIENVRLFNETKESLEQQTAISDVLRVISGSPSDVKPVLEAVAERAARICEANDARIFVVEGDELRFVTAFGDLPGAINLGEARPIERGYVAGRSAHDRAVIHVEDMQAMAAEYPTGRVYSQAHGIRTFLAVPLLREDRVLGVILLRRTVVRPFSEKQIALLKTFADQAAIAIENVRLFNETREALEHQTATSGILSVISSSPTDTAPVFEAIARSGMKLFSGSSVTVLKRVGEQIDLGAVTHVDPARKQRSRELYPIPLSRDYLTGRAILDGELTDVADIDAPDGKLTTAAAAMIRKLGYRALTVAPMMTGGAGIGAIAVGRDQPGALSGKQIALLRTFADQAVIAIRNADLFREIREKSAQLEIANKHKSEFLANMSHELRTPLNAIIGFSEVLMDKMFGEVNEKQADYLKDIHESGRHLLSLINDILDLSKIEAGRMELELSSFDLPSALSNAMTLVRERAQRHGIRLGLEVDRRLGEFQGDERKVKQILLNLLSNAVKFTPDGGRVEVSAKLDTTQVEIAVRDTGIGIAPEDQPAVFEEFKQVGRDYTRKAEGTGLGLALTKRFVELHGGEIRLESAPGKGSTFTFTLPVRQ